MTAAGAFVFGTINQPQSMGIKQLTLRDYFAALAMQAMLAASDEQHSDLDAVDCAAIAEKAYLQADMMIIFSEGGSNE